MPTSPRIQIAEPPLARFLFGDTRLAVVWLVIRLYVGYAWLMAGWGKLLSPAWIGAESGSAVRGFLTGALAKTAGDHPSVSWWYAWFVEHIALNHTELISYLVTFGELAIGIALILGVFTGIAAFFGVFMNMNFLFAGTVSVNPILGLLGLFLLLAWRTAGWLGLDRFLLPWLGVPWQPGRAFRR